MDELIWLNGRVLPLAQAQVSVEDRGFQFADGVYEVIKLYRGRTFALDAHLERLENSAGGISIQLPMPRPKLAAEIQSLVRKSGVDDGMIYLQLTRGVCPRNHLFGSCEPTLLFYCRALPPLPDLHSNPAVKLATYPDDRWRRCWIKSVALLPNVLAKNAAHAAGADEAAFVENNIVSECSSSNLMLVVGGKLVTHPVGPKVLPGITRAILIQCARELGIGVEERPVLLEEAKRADEIFITSTTREISPVSHWDGQPVATGAHSGPVTQKLHEAIRRKVKEDVAK